MQKRHGIIVGVTILIVALAITMVSSMIKKRGEVKQPPISVSDSVESTQNTGDKVKPNNNTVDNSNSNSSNTNSNNVSPNRGDTQNDVTNVDNNINNNSIFEVAEETVANPTSVVNEVMLVSSKKIMLIDLDVNSKDNKQMVYVVDMLSADGKKVSLYVNGVVYDDIKVGDTLNIHYNKYVNNKGVEVPLVIQATKTSS